MIILTKNTTKMMLRWLAGILGLMQPLLQAGVSLLHGLVVNGVGQRLGGAHERLMLTVALHRCLKHGIAILRILVGDMLYGAGENPFVKMYEKMIA